jgi:N-carbamoyl-L-amino-acid hydrolase
MTGSHYDTVRNGGKYDGRLGIFVPMACVRELAPGPPPALRL